MDLFKKRKTSGHGRIVKGWVTQRLGLTEDDVVTVAELACHEPGCPPVETVIAVHRSDNTRNDWRIHKALDEVEDADVELALHDRRTLL